MDNYYLMYNPTSGSFYAYGGRNFKWDGSSKPYVEKALDYINQLQEENAKMKEILKHIDVSAVDSTVVKLIMEL